MNTNQLKETMRKEENAMRDLLTETISIASSIAKDMYNLEIDYALEDDQVTFVCEDKNFKVEVTESGYSFIDVDAFELVCVRENMIEEDFYQLFSYHINYWLREIRRHAVIYVLFDK